ncbi:MAG: ATP-binding protein [Candidatus Poribacteria bacterium]|nr:ATP-binding protein [Candidatus Poribacteria bacterium]
MRAIRNRETRPPTIRDTALQILEYGNADGQVIASRLDLDFRRGEVDWEAQARAENKTPKSAIRLRKSPRGESGSSESAIEVTLPIKAGEKILGFVTGGYFLRDRLHRALRNQSRHTVYLREADELIPLNQSEDVTPLEKDNLLEAAGEGKTGVFSKIKLDNMPHSVIPVALPTLTLTSPIELIIAYSHENEIRLQRQLTLILFVVGAVGLLFAYVVSYLIGLRMTKPIHQLTAGVSRIASGELSHQLDVHTRDEIGQLTQGVNQMATDLKTNLERRISAERVAAWRDVARQIAHEIKNPLFPIRVSVENLQKARSQPEIFDAICDECTETIIEEVDRLQRMVDEFHQFARLPLPDRKPSDLNQIVEHTLNLYSQSLSGVQIEPDLHPDLPLTSIDPEQIAQVLQNLIKNAVEAMPDGGTLRILTQPMDGGGVAVEVQDTGMGMSSETQQEIFTPYYTTKDTGTGLGMAIVQRIITDHGGKISVTSEKGVGTLIRLEFANPNAVGDQASG